MVMPKPDLMRADRRLSQDAVLQIGADIYCDTRLIARELERRFPTPTLFPERQPRPRARARRTGATGFFEPGAGLSMGMNKDVPADVVNDRKDFFNFMDFSRLEADVPHMLAQLRGNADLVEQQLADGRDFLLGSDAGWADITAYFPLWMTRVFIPGGNELTRTLPEHRALGTSHQGSRARSAQRDRVAGRVGSRTGCRALAGAGRRCGRSAAADGGRSRQRRAR